jgi:hypothetical protein
MVCKVRLVEHEQKIKTNNGVQYTEKHICTFVSFNLIDGL